MDVDILSNKSVKPKDDILFSIIGDNFFLWQKILNYLKNNHQNISEEWNFSIDAKLWFYRTLCKKKTIFWIRVLQDTFRIAFWFGDKFESIIEQSDLPDYIKNDFKCAKKIGNMGRCISIDMTDSHDLVNVFKLIEIKIK